jgi:hypothetical protein
MRRPTSHCHFGDLGNTRYRVSELMEGREMVGVAVNVLVGVAGSVFDWLNDVDRDFVEVASYERLSVPTVTVPDVDSDAVPSNVPEGVAINVAEWVPLDEPPVRVTVSSPEMDSEAVSCSVCDRLTLRDTDVLLCWLSDMVFSSLSDGVSDAEATKERERVGTGVLLPVGDAVASREIERVLVFGGV